ncbi:MAG: winged helix-turn-helix domain-containing protein [Alphaproteobacteria bacterium]
MKKEPDIVLLESLIGDPARASMLTALMAGKALTATELAGEAGITAQTASSHLAKLVGAELLRQRRQGRHRYFSLASDDVGAVSEALMGQAAKHGHMRTRTGPKDPALQKSRVCYNHLAGAMGVRMFDSLLARGCLAVDGDDLILTAVGREFATGFGLDLQLLAKSRRPICKPCLDWSARRSHLAGALGTAYLDKIHALGWAKRQNGSRIIAFTTKGERHFLNQFPLASN